MGRLGASDNNDFFQPYRPNHVIVDGEYSLASWRAASGKDASSKEHWYTQAAGEEPKSHIFYNDTGAVKTVDLGSTRYLSLDQEDVSGNLVLQPYSSVVLIENGLAPLTLFSLSPGLIAVDQAADFTLTVYGLSFTSESVVRWNGADRPTTFVSQGVLRADISATDVSSIGAIPVTVYDPAPDPHGAETAPRLFYVVETVNKIYLPIVGGGG
jgi:hypothetical protein